MTIPFVLGAAAVGWAVGKLVERELEGGSSLGQGVPAATGCPISENDSWLDFMQNAQANCANQTAWPDPNVKGCHVCSYTADFAKCKKLDEIIKDPKQKDKQIALQWKTAREDCERQGKYLKTTKDGGKCYVCVGNPPCPPKKWADTKAAAAKGCKLPKVIEYLKQPEKGKCWKCKDPTPVETGPKKAPGRRRVQPAPFYSGAGFSRIAPYLPFASTAGGPTTTATLKGWKTEASGTTKEDSMAPARIVMDGPWGRSSFHAAGQSLGQETEGAPPER